MGRPRNISDSEILAGARACFLEHGAGVSTQLIAERLGISHAILFQRFGTKEQLMRTALWPSMRAPWMELARSGPDDRPIREQVRELVESFSSVMDEVVPCVSILRSAGIGMDEAASPDERPPLYARKLLAGWFTRALARNTNSQTKADHLADLFMGALHVRPFHQHLGARPKSRTDQRAYLELVVNVIVEQLESTGGRS